MAKAGSLRLQAITQRETFRVREEKQLTSNENENENKNKNKNENENERIWNKEQE